MATNIKSVYSEHYNFLFSGSCRVTLRREENHAHAQPIQYSIVILLSYRIFITYHDNKFQNTIHMSLSIQL